MTEQEKWEKMDTSDLIREYRRTGRLEIKQMIALRYIYLVKNIAIQIRGVYASFAQIGDIISEGVITLMRAIDKFDPDKNVRFDTYVSKRIRGMIIDLARQQDWTPRSVRKRMRDIDEAAGELFGELGRYPSDQEIAERLGLSDERYQEEITKTSLCNIMSLEALLEDRDKDVEDERLPQMNADYQPESVLQQKENLQILRDGIRVLRENEQLVLSLYYEKSMQMKEIAHILQVSEPRVSQIHANAIRKLRIHMTKYMNDEL